MDYYNEEVQVDVDICVQWAAMGCYKEELQVDGDICVQWAATRKRYKLMLTFVCNGKRHSSR
jgi:hypothetical protein